jgi:GxxExxY protein
MGEDNFLHSDITNLIIKAFYKVYNTLGYGFLEKAYHNAMLIELRRMGLRCASLEPVRVYYEEFEVGYYVSDIKVNECVVTELKAAVALCEEHETILVNYLRCTDIEVGIVLNFGKKTGIQEESVSRQNIKIIKNHHHLKKSAFLLPR